jgi:hypothetical protein
MTVIAFLFHYYKHDKIFNIDTPMKMNINSIDGDSVKFNWATNKIYIKLVGSRATENPTGGSYPAYVNYSQQKIK